MSLYVLRHGETAWSRERRHTGRTDIPLTDAGRAQARAAAHTLHALRGDAPFSLVLTSPLGRARETAALAGYPQAEADADLEEWDYGDVEGRTTDDFQQQWPDWLLWRDGCPGGENAAQVGARADEVLARRVRPVLDSAHGAGPAPDVLVVAHSHLLRVLTARWLLLPPRDGALFVLDTAAVGVLDAEHGIAAIRRWNLTPPPDAPPDAPPDVPRDAAP